LYTMETVTKTRVTSSVNETKALLTSDKTEKGSPRVDTSAPMKMAKPNKTRVEDLPVTPPDEKQRSVSFDLLSNAILHIPYDKFDTNLSGFNGFAASPAESIDIAVRDLSSQDICVSLLKRDTEMKVLFARNQEFFDTVKQINFEDEEGWNNFLDILYSKRDEKPDLKWMDEISEILSANPPFLVAFKQIIGYYENDDDANDNDSNSTTDNSNSTPGEEFEDYDIFDSCIINEPGYIDITPIRNYPMKLENLETSYPQFFINAKELLCKERKRRGSALGGNHLGDDNPLLHPDDERSEESSETLYDEFKRILITPKSVMDDNEWETSIYECLDPWPQLIDQFEAMLVPEIPEVIEIDE
jgi:hypothetical protein